MKDDFSFLYPPPRAVRFRGGSLDIRSLSFPLEILKKYEFLFSRFPVPSRGRGLVIVFHESPGPGGEAYTIDCEANRVVIQAGSSRGRFYALSTLLQVLVFHAGAGRMPAFSLHDAPEIAFRGFFLSAGPGTAPVFSDLRRLFLDLALLKFNHVALSPAAVGPDGLKELSGLARRAGLDLMLLDGDPGSAAILGPDPAVAVAAAGDWLAFFLDRCRQARAQGKRVVVWGDRFLARPEWIRRIPHDALVLNRTPVPERGVSARDAAAPFTRHHVPQALCPSLCSRDRIFPDARAGLARVAAACSAARAGKLAGVMTVGGSGAECGGLPEGAAMLHFQVGCLIWSGRLPGPASFSRWALGRDEPDLFRVYSFLAQAEHRLPHAHLRYLFEDPLLASYSRQGDPREVIAHFHKAALYLKKREIAPSELNGFIAFVRQLYEFIAAKAGFSNRIEALLKEGDGADEFRRQAARLEAGSSELKRSYLDAWSRHFRPDGVPEIIGGFDGLQWRFRLLAQTAASPAGRAELLAELKSGPPPDALLRGEEDGSWDS
jgi:hypothetical protein